MTRQKKKKLKSKTRCLVNFSRGVFSVFRRKNLTTRPGKSRRHESGVVGVLIRKRRTA